MLHCLSGTLSLVKLDHQTNLHLLNRLWNLTPSGYPVDCVCVRVCVHACMHVCSQKFVLTVLVFCFVMGYVLQFGEIAHKRIHLNYYFIPCKRWTQVEIHYLCFFLSRSGQMTIPDKILSLQLYVAISAGKDEEIIVPMPPEVCSLGQICTNCVPSLSELTLRLLFKAIHNTGEDITRFIAIMNAFLMCQIPLWLCVCDAESAIHETWQQYTT